MFKEKNAFVIAGGSDGLGAYLAKEAYALGYPVAIIGRDTYKLKKDYHAVIGAEVSREALAFSDVNVLGQFLDI